MEVALRVSLKVALEVALEVALVRPEKMYSIDGQKPKNTKEAFYILQ
jgi:hypothetical protein